MKEPLFATLLNVALIVLKLCNVLDISWIVLVFIEIVIYVFDIFCKGLIIYLLNNLKE